MNKEEELYMFWLNAKVEVEGKKYVWCALDENSHEVCLFDLQDQRAKWFDYKTKAILQK